MRRKKGRRKEMGGGIRGERRWTGWRKERMREERTE